MSTFLVELDHCSRIIKCATPRSLVILDELGRGIPPSAPCICTDGHTLFVTGTSTHDGVAVAKATLLYLINHVKCATLFVTHYPEISEISDDQQVVNLHMDYLLGDMKDGVSDVVFLYRAVSGEAGSSHGLNVAHLAGLPPHLLAIALAKTRELKKLRSNSSTVKCDSRDEVSFLHAISHALSHGSDEGLVRAQIAVAKALND